MQKILKVALHDPRKYVKHPPPLGRTIATPIGSVTQASLCENLLAEGNFVCYELYGMGHEQRQWYGLPRTFWYLWLGSLINRLGGFVTTFLSIYLNQQRGFSVAAA